MKKSIIIADDNAGLVLSLKEFFETKAITKSQARRKTACRHSHSWKDTTPTSFFST